MTKCQVLNCTKKSGDGIRLYSFPKDVVRCQLWINACGGAEWVKNTKNGRVCAMHFLKEDFRDTKAKDAFMHAYGKNTKTFLRTSAVPSLFLPDSVDNNQCTNLEARVDIMTEDVIWPKNVANSGAPEALFEEIIDCDNTSNVTSISENMFEPQLNSDASMRSCINSPFFKEIAKGNCDDTLNNGQDKVPESQPNLNVESQPCTMSDFAKGTLIWAQCNGWYPALVVCGDDVGQCDSDGQIWVYWIGDGQLSQVIKQYFDLPSYGDNPGFMQKVTFIQQKLLPFIDSEASIVLYPYPEIIQVDSDAHKNKCSTKNLTSYYRSKIHVSDDAAAFREPNIINKFKQVDPQYVCAICLNGGNALELLDHPVFELKVCKICSDALKPKLFALRRNAKCGYCTVCGLSNHSTRAKFLICSNSTCTRIYCDICVSVICPTNTSDVWENTRWLCFLCKDAEGCVIKPHTDWKNQLMRLYWGPGYIADKKPKMRVFSSFDGISTAKLILDQLDIDVELYCASEIDEEAMYVSNYHHPDILQLGDIKNIVKDEKLIESLCPIHFLIGGSPCEELSKANPKGMKLAPGFTGALVFEFAELKRLIEKYNGAVPLFYLYENVQSMPDNCRQDIEKALHCHLRNSEAVNFSVTHRPRVIGTNLPWSEHEHNNLTVKDLLDPVENRIANVEKVRTITTKGNSLRQGPNKIFPISFNGKGVYPSARELHLWMGFPKDYLYINQFSFDKMLGLIGKAFNVHQFLEIMRPLQYLFKLKSSDLN